MLLTLQQKKTVIIQARTLKMLLRKRGRETGAFPYFPVLFLFSHQMATTDCPPSRVCSPPVSLTAMVGDRSPTKLLCFQGSQRKEMQMPNGRDLFDSSDFHFFWLYRSAATAFTVWESEKSGPLNSSVCKDVPM